MKRLTERQKFLKAVRHSWPLLDPKHPNGSHEESWLHGANWAWQQRARLARRGK